jgi:uncharacterized membrane protein
MSHIYPGQAFNPLLYLPASAAVAWGRHYGWTVIDGLYLARVLNVLASIALGFAALRMAGGARLPLFAILMLPMSMAVSASVSQDGLILGLTGVAAAILSRAMTEDRPLRRAESLVAALAVAAVGVAKAPYAVMALLLLIAPAEDRRMTGVAAVGALTVAVAWNAWMSAGGWAPVPPPGMSTDAAAQAHFLLGHWDRIPHIAAETFAVYSQPYAQEFVGVLGWLDTLLPRPFYTAAYVMLATAFAAVAAVGVSGGWRVVRLAAPALAVVGAVGVCAALYIGWTNVGASRIDGVQGRYFLPLAMMLPLMLEGPRPILGGDRVRNGLRAAASAAVLAFPLLSLVVTEQALIERYYLS